MRLCSPKIYLKKIIYIYMYTRELFIMKRKSFENFGKLIRFLFIKMVKNIQKEDNKSTQIKYSMHVPEKKYVYKRKKPFL